MLGLRASYEAVVEERRIPCKTRTIMEALTGDDLEWFREAIAPGGIPVKLISDALKHSGITISDNTLSRHRKGLCSCQG